ncbi:MAG: hypothetical protein H0V94_07545 [Actinobacteria bacterium]|nr:hypothetical protein [Actinomycetota bacterium]
MRRALAWIAGGLGIAALLRLRRRPDSLEAPTVNPAAELRRKLAEAREAGDDRDEFDAAEGTPLDEVEAPKASLEERRAAIHAKAQEALGEMDAPNEP